MQFNVVFNHTEQRLPIAFSGGELLDVTFSEGERLDVAFDRVNVITSLDGVEHYGGDYVVTPSPTEQALNTAQKYLSDDVTIKEIPFFDVSNASGGRTIYIGKEID